MKVRLSIAGKLALILALFGVALLGSLGALAYTSGRAGLHQAATSELLTRAIEKKAALDSWISAARLTITSKAGETNVPEGAAALLAAAPGSAEAQVAHGQLVSELQPLIGTESNFTELFFVEAETGQVLAATDPGEEGKFKENMSYFINGKREPYVSEMYYSVTLGRPAMTAAAPVISKTGRLLGVLAGRLDLDDLNTLINRSTGLRKTEDAFLTNSIGLLVTQPRFISDPVVLQKTLRTEAEKRCIGGNSGVISTDDYRGVPALISYRWTPETQMCLIVKIDQAEAFAPSLAFTDTVELTGGLALVSAIVLALVIARTYTRPIRALQAGAARLSQGDLDYRVPVKSSDELGLLATQFNEMAASLQMQATERKHAERVQDALYTIAQTAATADSPQDLYASIHRALGNLMPADNFYVALYDPETDLISYPYFVDQYDKTPPPRKPGRGLTEYVLRTGRSVLADRQTFAQMVQQGELELVGTDSVDWLGSPLKTGDAVFGVMAVQSYTESVRLGTAEQEMLDFVSTQVAGAISRKRAEAALAQSHELLGVTQRMAKVGGWELDLETQTLSWSEEVYRIHEVDPATRPSLGEAINFYAPESRPIIASAVQAAIDSGTPWDLELQLITAQGRRIWARAQGAAERRGDKTVRLYGAFQDITERKQAQDRIQRQFEHLAALADIDRAISSSVDMRLSLSTIVTQTTKALRADAAAVLLLDPVSQVLEFAAGTGFRTQALQHTRLPLGQGYAGVAGLERRTVRVSNLRARHTDFLRSPTFKAEDFDTYFGTPLVAKGKLEGVLEVFNRTPLEPDQEWLDFLDSLAGQAAIAIDNVRLFEGLQRSNLYLTMAYDATIEGWSKALDLRDKETEGHTQRVTELTVQLARTMGLSDTELVHVRRGALLHDIGKMGVPDTILLKPDALTEQEWIVMKQHPVLAYEMLHPIGYLQPALDIPYCHHEKWDGTGYPRGLRAEQIPLAARIFAAVDVYDALTSDRPYRPAWTREKAIEHIRQGANIHFDPQVVEQFLRTLEHA
ncbi:MAG: HD domain-containing phosphohydrolase, partial [Chloroflexota bacterium]